MNTQAKIKNKRNYLFYIILSGILLAGFILRFLHLEEFPFAANQDELSNIYDGYSIAETGADRWGHKFPVILRAFGTLDYRPPMYGWLSAITCKLFGFSVSSGRLVSAILGFASLALTYLVAKKMAGKTFAIFVLLLTALSPWHIIFSRTASEGTILPSFFLISALYLWQKSYEKQYNLKSLVFLGICVGLGTNTYQASKLIFFLFTLLVIFDIWKSTNSFIKKSLTLGISCLIGAFAQVIAIVTTPEHFFSRAGGSMIKFSWSFQYVNDILRNISLHLSPDFLFFSFGTRNFLSVGRSLMIEVFFFYIGLFFIHRLINIKQAIKPLYFYLIIFIAILPSALTITSENPNALRASTLAILTPIITSAGIILLYKNFTNNGLQKAFLTLSIILIAWNSIYFFNLYVNSEDLRQQNMSATLAKACEKINSYQTYYNNILIEEDETQAYIFVLTYCNITPEEFHNANKQFNEYGWDQFKKINNFYFLTSSEIDKKTDNTREKYLILLHNRNKNYLPVDSVEVGSNKLFLYESSGKESLSINNIN